MAQPRRPQVVAPRAPPPAQYATRACGPSWAGPPRACTKPPHRPFISPRSMPPFPFPMPSPESSRPLSYVPWRFASGTFPVSRNYHLRQMLYNYADSMGRVNSKSGDSFDQVIPSLPFSDVSVYADTVDMESKLAVSSSALCSHVLDAPSAGVSHYLGLSLDARQCGRAHRHRRPPLSCVGRSQARRRIGPVSIFTHVTVLRCILHLYMLLASRLPTRKRSYTR